MTTTVSILIAFGVYLLGMIGIGIWSMRQTKGQTISSSEDEDFPLR